MKRLALVIALASIAGCGRVAELQPAAGHKLPVKPEMARQVPTAKELLTVPTYAKPNRVDELVKRSQPRPADPFDLPPPTGGAAPSAPAGTDPGAATNNATSVTPGE
jgi:hypothetical protein